MVDKKLDKEIVAKIRPLIKSTQKSIASFKKKAKQDFENENWKGASDTLRSIAEYERRLDILEDLELNMRITIAGVDPRDT